MKAAVSERQYQLLSIYTDGQASPQEIVEAESLIHSDMEARQVYEDLLTTKKLLRQARLYKAPKSYVLSLEQVKKPSRFAWPMMLRTSSALIAVVAFIFAVLQLNPIATTPPMAEMAPMTSSAFEDTTSKDMMQHDHLAGVSNSIIIWNNQPAPKSMASSAEGVGGMGGMGGGGTAASSAGLVSIAPSSTGAVYGSMSSNPATGGMGGNAGGQREIASADLYLQPPKPNTNIDLQPEASGERSSESSSNLSLEGSGPILGVQPEQTQGTYTVGPVVEAQPASARNSQGMNTWSSASLIAALGLMAVSFALLILSFVVPKS